MSVAPRQRRRAAATLIASSFFVALAQLGFAEHRGVVNGPHVTVTFQPKNTATAEVKRGAR